MKDKLGIPYMGSKRKLASSSLSATNNKKKVFESIFWNGKGDISQTKLF